MERNCIKATGKATIAPGDLFEIEENLIDLEAELLPGHTIVRSGTGDTSTVSDEHIEKASAYRREAIGIYREGVEVHSIINSIPLFPLLERTGGRTMPPKLAVDMQRGYVFHLLEMVFSIRLPDDLWPDSAEFAVDISGTDSHEEIRPYIVNFFPQETYEDLIKVESKIDIGLTGELGFALPQDFDGLTGLSKASANVAVGANFIAGPLKYALRRARIKADGLNKQRAQWHYLMQSELTGQSEFQTWVVVKTDQAATKVSVVAELGVVPYKKEWFVFRKHLKPMVDRLPAEVPL